MKKIIVLALAGILALSLVACGNAKPSLDEVEAALKNGTLTTQDALDKGYVTEEWIEEYRAANSVQAGNKLEAHTIGEFETKTIGGEAFTDKDLKDICYFAFLSPSAENAKEIYNTLSQNAKAVQDNGGEILIITTDIENKEFFADSEMTVIHYNDSFKEAMGSLYEMVNEDGFIATWNVLTAFPMAWLSGLSEDVDLASDLNSLHEMYMSNSGASTGNEADSAKVMG